MRDVAEIIRLAGGPNIVADEIKKTAAIKDVTPEAVKKWRVNGIPYQYWPYFIEKLGKDGLTADEILNANIVMRAPHESERAAS